MPQSTGWLSVMNCMVSRRSFFTVSLSVRTRIPAVTGMLQPMSNHGSPSSCSTSTMQMRQLPGTDSWGCQQKWGMSRPARRAAWMTVSPA